MKNTDKTFDGLLVLEYQTGNSKALSLLVKRHHKRMCKQAYWYVKNVEASSDIVQDCWGVIVRKLISLKEPNSFKSWSTKIVIRKSLDYINKEKRKVNHLKEIYYESKVKDEPLDKEREIKQLLAGIKKLPKQQQLVLRLFYLEEHSLKEISSILEISVGTVKSRLYHAREKLKLILKR